MLSPNCIEFLPEGIGMNGVNGGLIKKVGGVLKVVGVGCNNFGNWISLTFWTCKVSVACPVNCA